MEEKMMKDFCVKNFNIPPSKFVGGVELFDIERSKDVLDACEEHDIAVLGIEGFQVTEEYRTPDIECIVDFSPLIKTMGDEFPAYSRKSSRDFIEKFVSEGTFLEFVLVDFKEGE